MKVIIFAILIGSLLAVSPSALDQHYDDTLTNNLSLAMKKTETDAEHFSTNPVILPVVKHEVNKLAVAQMEVNDFYSARKVIKTLIEEAKNGSSHHTYHALFVAMDYKRSQARTYEFTLVRKDTSIVALLTKKVHEIESKDKYAFYFETYNSPFGLPFVFTAKAPVFDAELTPELIDYMRQYLLKFAEQTRGSNMHNHANLKGFAE
jgi:hypothetical protein